MNMTDPVADMVSRIRNGVRAKLPKVDVPSSKLKVEKMRGMNVTFVTSARTDEESKLLLQYLGMPFRTQSQ